MTGSPSICFSNTKVGVFIVSASTSEQVSGLKESQCYEYELSAAGYSLRPIFGVLAHSQIKHKCDRGWIEPGNYVGLLELVLCDPHGVAVDKTCVEVSSSKLDYHTEYRSMLEDIATRCADFLLQLESPVDQPFLPEDTDHEPTLAQRLFFLKNLLGGGDFQQALQRVVAMPNTRWREESKVIDVRQGRRLDRHAVRQFASAKRRVALPAGHPLRERMKTIPERIEIHDKRDTVDTAENRFVKHALSQFQDMLDRMLARFKELGAEKYPGLVAEVQDARPSG